MEINNCKNNDYGKSGKSLVEDNKNIMTRTMNMFTCVILSCIIDAVAMY